MRQLTRAARVRIVLLIALAAVTAPLWLPLAGLLLVVADPLVPAEAVAPLAGDRGARVELAAELLAAGYARRLVLTDIEPGPDGALRSHAHADHALALAVPAERLISTGRVVRSTHAELLALRDLARSAGWRTLIIVTSPEHTRRVRAIANEIFRDAGVAVIVRPATSPIYEPARWWRDADERKLTLLEYPKLLLFYLGYQPAE